MKGTLEASLLEQGHGLEFRWEGEGGQPQMMRSCHSRLGRQVHELDTLEETGEKEMSRDNRSRDRFKIA